MSRCRSELWRTVVTAALAFLLAVCALPAHAQDAGPDVIGASGSGRVDGEDDYYRSRITAFDVDITVGDDNVYHVVNEIDMEFRPDSYSHGILMNIDLEPYVFFEQDGEYYSKSYRVFLSNVQVEGGPWEADTEDGRLQIRVGDEDTLVDGRTMHYTIAYDYDAGNDGFSQFDMFYYAIIGNGWNQTIDNPTFRIHMPKAFDADEMGFSVGSYGDEGYDPARLTYSVDGTTIMGAYDGRLEPYEGITIRIPLPEGYYEHVRTVLPAAESVLWVTGGLSAGALGLWCIFRPRRRLVVPVEVEPPEGLSSADVGYIIDGTADTQDIVSLIMWWASRGYLRIVQIAPKPGKKKSPGLLLVREKDLPENADSYQYIVFEKLFEDGDRVAVRDLKYHFSSTVTKAISRLKDKFASGPAQLYTTTSKVLSDVCCGLAAVPPALLTAVGIYSMSFSYAAAVVVGIVVFGICYAVAAMYCFTVYKWQARKRNANILSAVLCGVAIGVIGLISCAAAWPMCGPWGFLVLCFAAVLLIAPFFRARTEQGQQWYGQILGLKRFIERAEKSRIEMLAAENPEYFYDILPFAYVLGVTDVWAKQFEDLAVPPPSWYSGSDAGTFSTIYFASTLSHEMTRAQNDMTAVRSSGGSGGGGGGFSGGGFSGGGFGGSGGGSW